MEKRQVAIGNEQLPIGGVAMFFAQYLHLLIADYLLPTG
jgi:hypothetical protein